MAIIINSINGYALLEKAVAGLSTSSCVADLKAASVSIHITPTKVVFRQGPETLSAFMCKSSDLEKISKGGPMSPGVAASFKNALNHAWSALQHENSGAEPLTPTGTVQAGPAHSVKSHEIKTVIDMLLQSSPKNTASTDTVQVGPGHTAPLSVGLFPVAQMQTAPLVPLETADRLYQPVNGSSGGSRYFVVALRSDLKVAARYRGDKLSIRVEGKALKVFSKALDVAGFASSNGPYRSLHLGPLGGPVMAGRTLGSVLCGMNIDFVSTTPQIGVIANKGN